MACQDVSFFVRFPALVCMTVWLLEREEEWRERERERKRGERKRRGMREGEKASGKWRGVSWVLFCLDVLSITKIFCQVPCVSHVK